MNKYERSYVLDLVLKVMEGLCEGAGDVPVLVHVTEGTVRTEAPDAGVGHQESGRDHISVVLRPYVG